MTLKRWPIFLLAGLVLAQGSTIRVLTIQPNTGAEVNRTGNLRNGPWVYQSAKPGGVLGKVKDLQITGTTATFSAPDGKTMQEAEGSRNAVFEGNVVVRRGRVTAQGPRLTYSENTGQGVLDGPAIMRQTPNKGEDPVDLSAQRMTFDVDTDVTSSNGNVSLQSGRQTGKADAVYYEEDRGLAVFTDNDQVVLTRSRDGEGDLVIRAREIRSLTSSKRLIAKGGVSLVDGDITTTGTSLYYDDKTGQATVVGSAANPVVSVNKKQGTRITGATLLHDVNKNRVANLGRAFTLPESEFQKAK